MSLLLKTRWIVVNPIPLILIVLWLGAFRAGAQLSTVTVNGTVTDSSGAAIPDAKIIVTNTATGLQKTAVTDAQGSYVISNLDPGTYNIQASASGFSTVLQRGAVLHVGQTVTFPYALHPADVTQTVEVESASAQAVPTTESMVERVIVPQEVDNFPSIARSFSDLAALSPGVTVSTPSLAAGVGNSGGTVTIGNATSYQTGWIVDNANAENDFIGGLWLKFAQDWISEFSLVSQQAPAEYGEAAGGFINAITRSGGNSLHGRAYMYYQNADMNATPQFLPAAQPGKPPYDLERAGGFIGGPIKKDKLFYFGGYEFFHSLQSVPVNVPAAFQSTDSTSGVFPQTLTTHIWMGKGDWQLSSRDRITLRLNSEHDAPNNSGIGLSGGSYNSLGTSTFGHTLSWLPMASWTRTISPTIVNELLFTYGREAEDSYCRYATDLGSYPGFPSQTGSAAGGDPVGWWATVSYPTAAVVTGCPSNGWSGHSSNDSYDWQQSTIADTLTISKGSHDISFGVAPGFYQVVWGGIYTNGEGNFSINGSVPFNPNTPSTYPISDLMNGYGGPTGGEHFNQYGPNISFFAEDSYRIKPNLTLNYGLRYHIDFLNSMFTNDYINPALASGLSACGCGPLATPGALNRMNNDYGNIAPRFGFAWQPFHDHDKTVLRGGVGVFYDESHSSVVGEYYGQSIGNQDPIDVNATRPALNPYCYGNPCGSTAPTQYQQYVEETLAYALATYTLPNFTLGTYQMPNGGPVYTIPAPTVTVSGQSEPAPTTSGSIIDDSNIKTPGEVQISVGVGQDLTSHFNMAADYVYIRGFDQYIQRNNNISMQGTLINPAYGDLDNVGNGGVLRYNSLRIKASYRDVRGDSAQVAYTLASAWNNTYGTFSFTGTGLATDPFNYQVDWGPAAGNPLNTLNLNGLFKVPFGIGIAPIFSFTSAVPYQATTTQTTAVPGCLVYYTQCYPAGYGKNSLRGAYTYLLSARLSKSIQIREGKSISLFAEGYNIPNHGNYGTDYQANVLSSSFLKPDGTSTPMRQLQLGGRFDF